MTHEEQRVSAILNLLAIQPPLSAESQRVVLDEMLAHCTPKTVVEAIMNVFRWGDCHYIASVLRLRKEMAEG